MKKKWQAKHIPTRVVLETFARPFREDGWRDESLVSATGAPLKVVWAAMLRDDRAGFLDYGMNLRGGWLTPTGEKKLEELRGT